MDEVDRAIDRIGAGQSRSGVRTQRRKSGLERSQFLSGLRLASLAAIHFSKRHRNDWKVLHLCSVAVWAAV